MSSTQLKWTRTAEEFDAFLARWQGVRAEAWAYHVSHAVFYLALHRKPSVAYLQFKDCQAIHLYRTFWEPANLAVNRTTDRLGILHTVTDPGNFELVCWAAFGAEADRFITFPEIAPKT